MARYLSVVETAYRATLEEQDDTGVWFTHAMKNAGAEVAVLLRGDAACYALRGQDAGGLRFGTRELTVPPRLEQDVAALVAAKVPVLLVSEDAAERGIAPDRLVPGVERIPRSGVAKMIEAHDRVLYW